MHVFSEISTDERISEVMGWHFEYINLYAQERNKVSFFLYDLFN